MAAEETRTCRNRSANFSQVEKNLLISILEQDADRRAVIHSIKKDQGTLERKELAWAEIVHEFNSRAACMSPHPEYRGVLQLKCLQRNLSARARKHEGLLNSLFMPPDVARSTPPHAAAALPKKTKKIVKPRSKYEYFNCQRCLFYEDQFVKINDFLAGWLAEFGSMRPDTFRDYTTLGDNNWGFSARVNNYSSADNPADGIACSSVGSSGSVIGDQQQFCGGSEYSSNDYCSFGGQAFADQNCDLVKSEMVEHGPSRKTVADVAKAVQATDVNISSFGGNSSDTNYFCVDNVTNDETSQLAGNHSIGTDSNNCRNYDSAGDFVDNDLGCPGGYVEGSPGTVAMLNDVVTTATPTSATHDDDDHSGSDLCKIDQLLPCAPFGNVEAGPPVVRSKGLLGKNKLTVVIKTEESEFIDDSLGTNSCSNLDGLIPFSSHENVPQVLSSHDVLTNIKSRNFRKTTDLAETSKFAPGPQHGFKRTLVAGGDRTSDHHPHRHVNQALNLGTPAPPSEFKAFSCADGTGTPQTIAGNVFSDAANQLDPLVGKERKRFVPQNIKRLSNCQRRLKRRHRGFSQAIPYPYRNNGGIGGLSSEFTMSTCLDPANTRGHTGPPVSTKFLKPHVARTKHQRLGGQLSRNQPVVKNQGNCYFDSSTPKETSESGDAYSTNPEPNVDSDLHAACQSLDCFTSEKHRFLVTGSDAACSSGTNLPDASINIINESVAKHNSKNTTALIFDDLNNFIICDSTSDGETDPVDY